MRRWLALLGVGVCLSASCRTVGFYRQAVAGQVEVLAKRQPVERLLGDPSLDERLRRQMELSQQLLAFAEKELKMPNGGSYTLYTDLQREHLVWVVYAVPELSLEPKRWWYPFVGRQDYRGFFDPALADKEQQRLRDQGYETWSEGVDAYSSLGMFRDPLLNTFVHYEEVELAGVIFHELVHRTYYVAGSTKFNEGMAEAVAREGVRRWLRAAGRREEAVRYEESLRRVKQAGAAIQETVRRLREVYGTDASEEQKRADKARELAALKRTLAGLRGEWGGGLQSWIEGPINNARLHSFLAYEDEVPRFEALLRQCGGDFAVFWEQVRELEPTEE